MLKQPTNILLLINKLLERFTSNNFLLVIKFFAGLKKVLLRLLKETNNFSTGSRSLDTLHSKDAIAQLY